MPDLGDTSTRLHAPGGSRISRRRVLGTAAWSAPAIVVATATPALATSPASVLTAAFNADSFRTSSGANFTAGTPVDGTYGIGVRIDLSVSGPAITSLTATLSNRAAAPNGFTIFNNTAQGNRGTTVWKASQASLADDGWTVSPTPSSTQVTSFIFTRSGSFTSGSLRFVIGGFSAAGTNSDFPATVQFTSNQLSNSPTVTITTNTTDPFVSGS